MKRSTMVRWSWVGAIALAVILLYVALVWSNWCWLRGGDSPGAAIRNAGLVLASALALALAVWRSIIADRQAAAAQAQLALAERDSLDARYQKGADMLSSENISTRIGGVYALKRLAENHSDRFHIQIMELLCAFVRHPPKAKESRRLGDEDVTAALDFIIHRSDDAIAIEEASRSTPRRVVPAAHPASEEGFQVNLEGANLELANLQRAKLRGAMLDNVAMMSVWAEHADFSEVYMSGADMSNSTFWNSSFVKTVMGRALSKADFEGANLTGARFNAANLRNTILENTDLSGARFEKVVEITRNTSAVNGLSENEHFCQVTQRQLDSAMANPDDPPQIEEGTTDIETGKPIVWNHKLCGGRWLEHQKSRNSM